MGANLDTPIVESARLQDALNEARQMLDDAQRLTKTGSWVIDPIGGGASASAEGYRILGLPGKTTSANFMECLVNVHPDDLPAVLKGFQECVATGEPRPLQYRIVFEGVATDIETVAQPVRDDSGRVVRVVGTVMDVTERKRTQDALRASEKLARGQLGALTGTLEALVQEASPDRLPEVVLRAIAQQFDAFSITVWLTDNGSGRTRFAFQFVEDRLLTVEDSEHPAPRSSVEVPMLIAGQVAGLIAIGFRDRRDLRAEEIALAQALANQAMLAVQLTRLSEQSREAAVIAERQRVLHDVHDTLAHAFTGVIVQLEAADDASSRGLEAEAGAHVARAEAMARTGLHEARRSVMALRPEALESSDLSGALNGLLTTMTDATSVVAAFSQRGATRALPRALEENLLRIGQEALTNALRHARAEQLAMQLTFDSNMVRFELRDDGRGFDPSDASDGLGLSGIRARTESMGGRLVLTSAIGAGTTVSVTVPLSAGQIAP